MNDRLKPSERYEYVLAQRDAGRSLQEIADELKISRGRVRQLAENARRTRRRIDETSAFSLTPAEQLLAASIVSMPITVRSLNALHSANIRTVGELCQRSPKELLGLKHFGKRCLREVKDLLKEVGLSLVEPQPVLPDQLQQLERRRDVLRAQLEAVEARLAHEKGKRR